MIRLPKATILLVLLLTPLAYGQEENIDIDENEFAYEYCKWMSLLAKDVMVMRQDGDPMSETLPMALDRLDHVITDIIEAMGLDPDLVPEGENYEMVAGFEDGMDELRSIITQVVIASYDVPVYTSSTQRRRVIDDTENTMFGGCYQGLGDELSGN